MKKAFSIILSLLLLCSLAVTAMAAGETVVYTSDSSFVAGGTVKVNEQKTMQNIMDFCSFTFTVPPATKLLSDV